MFLAQFRTMKTFKSLKDTFMSIIFCIHLKEIVLELDNLPIYAHNFMEDVLTPGKLIHQNNEQRTMKCLFYQFNTFILT